jgi:hypothetical protein
LRTIAGFFEKYPPVEKTSLPVPGTMRLIRRRPRAGQPDKEDPYKVLIPECRISLSDFLPGNLSGKQIFLWWEVLSGNPPRGCKEVKGT